MARPDTRVLRTWLARLTAVLVVAGVAVVAVQAGDRSAGTRPALDATAPAAPLPDAEELVAADPGQERQAALVRAEDDRLFAIVSEPPRTPAPYEVAGAPGTLPTVVLTPRERPYDLPGLERLGAVERQADGGWLLRRSVVVGRGAELRVQEPGGRLRLASAPDGIASLVAFKGALALSGGPGAPLEVTSWDPATGRPDVDRADGRAYVRAVGGRLDLAHTALADLGFWSGRTGGVAWTGSTGAAATGSALAVTVDRAHYGLFASRATGLALEDVALRGNDLDGLLLHRETDGLTARRVAAVGNGRDGLAAARGSREVVLSDVVADRNARNGIRIDGSPLAAEATAGGASTARGSGFTVERATVTGNAEEGVLVAEAGRLVVRDSAVTGNRDGVVVRGPAAAPAITGTLLDAQDFALALRGDVRGALVAGNTVGGAAVGVQLVDSSAEVRGNTTTGPSRYAVSLVGDVTGSVVTGNALAGRGLAAVDAHRIALGATADVTGNDEGGWVRDRDDVAAVTAYVEQHPLLFLWLGILVLPVLARLRAKRRRRAAGEHPYADSALRPAVAVAAVAAPPVTAGRRPSPHPVESTVALPVTRVTVVSGAGARR